MGKKRYTNTINAAAKRGAHRQQTQTHTHTQTQTHRERERGQTRNGRQTDTDTNMGCGGLTWVNTLRSNIKQTLYSRIERFDVRVCALEGVVVVVGFFLLGGCGGGGGIVYKCVLAFAHISTCMNLSV